MIETTTVVEKVGKHTYDTYVQIGGRLAPHLFKTVAVALQEERFDDPFSRNDCSASQAMHMARHSQLCLTATQIHLYSTLRRTSCGLSDQVLLAEIVRLTDENNFERFTGFYPEIFDLPR